MRYQVLAARVCVPEPLHDSFPVVLNVRPQLPKRRMSTSAAGSALNRNWKEIRRPASPSTLLFWTYAAAATPGLTQVIDRGPVLLWVASEDTDPVGPASQNSRPLVASVPDSMKHVAGVR